MLRNIVDRGKATQKQRQWLEQFSLDHEVHFVGRGARKGDRIMIEWRGIAVPGWIALASENQVSLLVQWQCNYGPTIAGHLGNMPLLRGSDGNYYTLMHHERVDIEIVQ